MTESLSRLAAACLLPGFQGPVVPEGLRSWLEAGIGGVVLFGSNIVDAEQLASLTAELRAERPGLLVMTDEEGGDVTRLEAQRGSSYPGNLALGAVDDVGLTERVATAIGADLAAVGVNLNLAPVADVNTNPRNPVIGVRSFGSDPELVARHVAAFVRGLQGAGIAACAKHFPGHGDTHQDSHLELPSTELRSDALVPFRAAIDAGVRSVMTAHIRLEGIEDDPVTVSPQIIGGLLRQELGFDGLVMSDAVEMRAISGTIGLEEAAVRALGAGVDLVMLGAELGLDALESMHRALVERVPGERLAEAARRVEGALVSGSGAVADRGVGLEAARRAVRVEGDAAVSGSALVVELVPEPMIAAGAARHGLGELLQGAEVVRLGAGDAAPPVGGREVVLVVRDAHRHAWQRETADALLLAVPRAVVVEIGLPQWRPERAAGYVTTLGGGRANLEAAAELLQPGDKA